MDPSRTLVTFLLETDPSIASVDLIGSWDNFSACYAMQRDIRRGRGHWRGCHAFQTLSGDDMSTRSYKTDAGLAMGHTYHYYYQVNGSTEAYDPVRPTTTACPSLPGQVVNSLYIPVERSLRQRSASLNSLDQESFRTMDPQSKFRTPQPVPAAAEQATRSIGTAAPATAPFAVVSREEPPKSSWRRFLARKLSSRDMSCQNEALRGRRPSTQGQDERSIATASSNYDARSTTAPSEVSQMRDVSPTSPHRFLLSEDLSPTCGDFAFDDLPLLSPAYVPYDIAEMDEEDYEPDDGDDDHDNFATPAAINDHIYTTRLSPPPFKRSNSSDSEPATALNSSALTLIPLRQQSSKPTTALRDAPTVASPVIPKLETSSLDLYSCPSDISSAATSSPVSPQSLSAEFPSSFYDDSDDADALSTNDDDITHESPSLGVFHGYSLPRPSYDDTDTKSIAAYMSATGAASAATGAAASSPRFATVHSPQLLPRGQTAADAATTQNGNGVNFLGSSLDVGLDDFAAEMGWLAESISTRHA